MKKKLKALFNLLFATLFITACCLFIFPVYEAYQWCKKKLRRK